MKIVRFVQEEKGQKLPAILSVWKWGDLGIEMLMRQMFLHDADYAEVYNYSEPNLIILSVDRKSLSLV